MTTSDSFMKKLEFFLPYKIKVAKLYFIGQKK